MRNMGEILRENGVDDLTNAATAKAGLRRQERACKKALESSKEQGRERFQRREVL